ncbi:MAG: hypothetical protein AB1689_19495, partial [Thermodesulfobacteriota bacterium]
RRAAAADAVVTDLVAAATRLADARDALARGACARIAPAGAVPTQILLASDARSVLVRPLTALRAGRRYALVAYGFAAPEVERLRESLVPRPQGDGLLIPEGAFAEPAAEAFAGDAGGISAARTTELVRRLTRDAAAMPGLGPFSGVRVTLPEPLRAEQLGELRFAFVPADAAPAGSALAVYRTLDPRDGLLAYRARLAGLDCPATAAEARDVKQELGARLPHVARLLHGTYRSLDLGDAAGGAARALGVPAGEARAVERPYLLALPRDVGPQTPLVLAVDGHAGRASRILGKHAAALAERGIAVLAVELPHHGERRAAGREFLDALDPADLGRNIRQAAVDVLAAVQAVARCGLRTDGGETLRFARPRYLGYSLGGMVGALARSVEPLLGTTVLVAPGGDILGWLMWRIAPELGATYVTCLGGPAEGQSCVPTGRCTAPAVCITDPYLERLQLVIALPYEIAAAAGDPLSYATHRTGGASDSRLLLVTAGDDVALHPLLATRLADAYGMRPVAARRRRGPRSQMVQWPQLGHDLIDRPAVRAQVYEFLASDGRRLLVAEDAAPAEPPGWYKVYGPSRR